MHTSTSNPNQCINTRSHILDKYVNSSKPYLDVLNAHICSSSIQQRNDILPVIFTMCKHVQHSPALQNTNLRHKADAAREHDQSTCYACKWNRHSVASKGYCIAMQSEATLTFITLCTHHVMPLKNIRCSRVHPTLPLQLAGCCGVLMYLSILCIDGTNGAVLEHDF